MYQVTAFAALAAVAAAAPAAGAQRAGFTIAQVNNGQKYLNGPAAYAAAFYKYNKPVPAHVQSAAIAVQSGSVTANPEAYDASYLCPVSIGTPAQVLNLDFDTGSSDLWVFSSLQSASTRSGHSYYTPSSSSSSRQISGETWSIQYGDGSGAKGVAYYDKVVIGGVTATSQGVEAATSISSQFQSDTDNDGLVGFAFDSLNTGTPTKLKTWFTNVQSTLPSPIFASYLRKGVPGAYDFGYINSTRYTGSLDYTSISTSQGFWEFTTGGYAIGSTTYSTGLDVIADTGTTLVYLPSSVVSAYYSRVSGAQNSNAAGGYIFPCSASLPTFSIRVNGVLKTIPGSYINFAPNGDGTCYGGIQSSAGLGINILGDIFLKSQYVVWNHATPSIGFATQSGR